MLQASTLAGLSMAVGLGAAHALAHSLGAHYNLHHGLAVGAVLPGVMTANLPGCEMEYARAYRYTQLDLSKKSIHSQAVGLIISTIELMESLRVPDLFEINSGIDFNHVAIAASRENFLLGTNPVELTKEELFNILSKSYKEVQNVKQKE
jgi:alcohol dehydrogenase class IV